jgi:hypothetical protein
LPLDVTADAGDALVDESALLKVELGLMYRWSFNRGANVDVDGFIDFDVDVKGGIASIFIPHLKFLA